MVKDMTSGSPMKLIVHFSIPIVIGNLFQQLYNMVDSVVVGQFIGKEALAAVGATGSLNFLVIGFVLGVCSGFCIPIAQAFGAGDEGRMRRYIANAVYLCILITVVLTGLMMLATRPILALMNTPENIFDYSYSYIIVIFAGIFATMFYNILAGILRALGDSKTPLYFLIVSSLLNVGMDLLFILAFDMGVAGAAYATVLAQLISALLCFLYICKKFPILRISREEWKLCPEHWGRLLYIGLPMAFQFSITAIGSIVLQSAVNGLGSDVVAAVTAAGKVQMVVTQPLETLGITMATFCGQNLGAGRIDRVQDGVKRSLIVSTVCGLAGWVLVWFLGGAVSLLFIKPEETEILRYVVQFLRVNGGFYILLGSLLVLRNALQGLGFSVPAMFAGMFELVARALVGIFLVAPFGYAAVCMANPTAWIFANILLIPVYLRAMRALKARYPVKSA